MKVLRYNSGQALLLVLLSMAVVLTIVLSILSRSVTDIAITSRSEEALRAFSAAEAGVEQALVAGGGSGTIGQATFNAVVSGFASGTQQFVDPQGLYSGESMIVWFVSHNASGNLVCDPANGLPCFTGNHIKVCWGKSETPVDDKAPAVEMSVVYLDPLGDYANAKIARVTLDPTSSRRVINNFSDANVGICTINENSFKFQRSIDLSSSSDLEIPIPASSYGVQNGLQFARIKLLYNTDTAYQVGIDVTGSGSLPSQGLKIDSSGQSGESNRKIEVFQSYGDVPLPFESAVFSIGDLVK